MISDPLDCFVVPTVNLANTTITLTLPEQMFAQVANAVLAAHYSDDGKFLFMRRVRRVTAPPITPAIVVTLCTLGAFEWLRHRKAEVRAAEESGDYSALFAEFVAWLRALLDSWRKAGT